MRDVLEQLSSTPGIVGSLVATTDGMVVYSCLRGGLDEDAAAALVSSLLTSTVGLLSNCGRSRMEQLVLQASRGKIIVSDLGNAYLVAVTDRNLNIDQGFLEIKSAANSLRKLGRM
jgi:predicted regulator of Ras-like GTPase activity (Roadblock/LC7/MglB family)